MSTEEQLAQANADWAQTDTAIRELLRPILGAFVDGDNHGVPGLTDLVEMLVKHKATVDKAWQENQRLRDEKHEAEAILGWAGGGAAGLISACHNATSALQSAHAALRAARQYAKFTLTQRALASDVESLLTQIDASLEGKEGKP